jgi:hypothetical protein
MAEAAGEDEPADADESAEGGEVAEDVDAGGGAEQPEDEAVSALVMEDPTSFATASPKLLPRPARTPTTRRSLRPPQASIPMMPSGIKTR